jgi:uridine phosphorylase
MSVQYHIRCGPGDVGEFVLLPGDPGRSEVIAKHLTDAKLVARHREYTTYTGTLDGNKVSVCSTGIGSSSTAIAIEELAAIGARTLIRVGTTGSLQPQVHFGDLVIAEAAVRDEGTTPAYVPLAFPARAERHVLIALLSRAERSGHRWHAGVVRSHDALYADLQAAEAPRHQAIVAELEVWRRAGVLCNDMETSTLFTLGALRNLRTGTILMTVNEPGEEGIDPERVAKLDLTPMIQVALEAIRLLAANHPLPRQP